MRSDDRQEPSLVLVDDLEKVDDPELGDAPREAGQIGEHHRPVLTEEVPDALGGGALLRALLDESPQPDLAPLQVLVGAVGHSPAPPHCSRMAKEGSYEFVAGNPPYQGLSKTESFGYVATTYPRDKADLYAAFLERALDLAKPGGASALLTMRGWMFLGQFTDLRTHLLRVADLRSLGDVDRGAFEDVPDEVLATVMSVFRRAQPEMQAVALQPTPPSDRSRDGGRTGRKHAAVLARVGRYEFDPRGFEVIEGALPRTLLNFDRCSGRHECYADSRI